MIPIVFATSKWETKDINFYECALKALDPKRWTLSIWSKNPIRPSYSRTVERWLPWDFLLQMPKTQVWNSWRQTCLSIAQGCQSCFVVPWFDQTSTSKWWICWACVSQEWIRIGTDDRFFCHQMCLACGEVKLKKRHCFLLYVYFESWSQFLRVQPTNQPIPLYHVPPGWIVVKVPEMRNEYHFRWKFWQSLSWLMWL